MLNKAWCDQVTGRRLREETCVRLNIFTLEWTQAGHVARKTENRWTSRLTYRTPRESRRSKGRQRARVREELGKFDQIRKWEEFRNPHTKERVDAINCKG